MGRARAKKGMFEGDMAEGELEIGQVASQIKQVMPAADILHELIAEYEQARTAFAGPQYQLRTK